MNDIAKLLTPVDAGTAPFPEDSRYHGAPLKTATLADGREVRFTGRRFLPQPGTVDIRSMTRVRGGDRLDLLAAEHFGTPSQGWKLLDANQIRDARTALDEVGARLAIGEAPAFSRDRFK
ncbi:hypothetical protein [Poseidonocella sedimentorum]|uniref:Uncharacterized protein n=1 Tax=Poseidonocella sedimentorum TaxID=871652 RepID=A0A1I6DPG3_9RHOB|nr:hypothetical protein [Poseidonocella sedimentorum]SFR07252.1 hypothetical protein SAMN04515673_104201 [Poseidonocella sedimentorum]